MFPVPTSNKPVKAELHGDELLMTLVKLPLGVINELLGDMFVT